VRRLKRGKLRILKKVSATPSTVIESCLQIQWASNKTQETDSDSPPNFTSAQQCDFVYNGTQ
jgi:ubiquitin